MPELIIKREPLKVEWAKRPYSDSAWISVGDPKEGPHFQCDYLGDLELGPKSRKDFAARPPRWVIEALELDV